MQGLAAGINVIAEWVMRISIVNMIWFLINIPAAVIVFFMIISPSTAAVFLLSLPLLVLAPLLFFPSSIAVYAVSRDWVTGNSVSSIWMSYWRHFIKNYREAAVTGFFLTLIWAVWAADLYFFRNNFELLAVVFTILGALLFVYTLNLMSVFVHFNMTKKQCFKNAFAVTFGSPLLTLLILFVNAVILYLTVRFVFTVVFFSMAASAIAGFFLFYRFTLKVKEKTE